MLMLQVHPCPSIKYCVFKRGPGTDNITTIPKSNPVDDVIMSAIASQINSLTIVYSTVYSGVHQRKHQSSTSLAFVQGIHRWPVNFPHKGTVTRQCFHLMTSSWNWLSRATTGCGIKTSRRGCKSKRKTRHLSNFQNKAARMYEEAKHVFLFVRYPWN